MVVCRKDHVGQTRFQSLHTKCVRKEGFNINFKVSWVVFFPSRVTVCFTFNKSGHYRTSRKEKHFIEKCTKEIDISYFKEIYNVACSSVY